MLQSMDITVFGSRIFHAQKRNIMTFRQPFVYFISPDPGAAKTIRAVKAFINKLKDFQRSFVITSGVFPGDGLFVAVSFSSVIPFILHALKAHQ